MPLFYSIFNQIATYATGLLGNHKRFIDLTAQNKKFILCQNDILIARIGSVGKSLCFESLEPSIFASYLIRLHVNSKKVISKYLKYFFESQYYWDQVKFLTSGAVQPQLNAPALKKIKILLPSLAEQEKIVEALEKEGKLIETQEEVIRIFEKKTKDRLNDLYGNAMPEYPSQQDIQFSAA